MTMLVRPRILIQSIDITQELHVRFELSNWPFSRSNYTAHEAKKFRIATHHSLPNRQISPRKR